MIGILVQEGWLIKKRGQLVDRPCRVDKRANCYRICLDQIGLVSQLRLPHLVSR